MSRKLTRDLSGYTYADVVKVDLVDYGKPDPVTGEYKQRYEIDFKDGRYATPRRVSTVLGTLGKPALPQWAANTAVDYLEAKHEEHKGHAEEWYRSFPGYANEARNYHDLKKKEAAEWGKMAHSIIEDFLRGKGWPDEERLAATPEPVLNCLGIFRAWWESTEFKRVKYVERYVYNLSESYAGTLDYMPEDSKGRLHLIDWKTSKSIYEDYLFQLAAYAGALKLCSGEDVETATIVRIGKTDLTPQILTVSKPDLRKAYTGFVHLCKVHEARAEMKKLTDASKAKHKEREATQAALLEKRAETIDPANLTQVMAGIMREVRERDIRLHAVLADAKIEGVINGEIVLRYSDGYDWHYGKTQEGLPLITEAACNVLGDDYRVSVEMVGAA